MRKKNVLSTINDVVSDNEQVITVVGCGGDRDRAKRPVMARIATTNIVAAAEGRPERASYLPEVSIVCLMDIGRGAALVRRDDKVEKLVSMPVYGHWLKKAWGGYYRRSKLKSVPRVFG